MKTTVQKSALVTALLLLTACAGGPGGSSISLGIGGFGNHIGLGTSVNIPIGSRTPAADKGGINVTKKQIITHFAADGTASEQAVKGGSYRRLLNVLTKKFIYINNLANYIMLIFSNAMEKRYEKIFCLWGIKIIFIIL